MRKMYLVIFNSTKEIFSLLSEKMNVKVYKNCENMAKGWKFQV